MKLATKIFCGMGILTVLIGVLAAYLLTQMSTMNDVTSVLAEKNVPVALLAGNVSTDTAEFRVLGFRLLLEQDQASQKDILERMVKARRNIQDEIAKLEQLVVTGQAAKSVQDFKRDIAAYIGVSDEIVKLQQQNQNGAALDLIKGKSYEAYGNVDKSSNTLLKIAEENALKRGELCDSLYEKSHTTGIGLTFFALMLAASSCLLIVRDTTKQLGKDPQELNSIAKRVVGGDYAIDDGSKKIGVFGAIVDMVDALKKHIERAMQESDHAREQSQAAHEAKNEAEAAQNAAQTKTKAILAAAVKLEEVSQIVSSASSQLSAQIEQSDRGAAQAAQRLAEAATAMNEMNATVQEVASNAAQASTASAETRQKAENGASIVQDSLSSIGRVQSVSVELKQDMAELSTHAQAISQIMSVISDIADQTNLLALNAAIEAARAGEAGRGFAVVADEVRKLAEKTMASTNDVGNAISAIQQSTAKSMDSMDNAVTQIAEATKFANSSGDALKDILTTVTGTADQVNAIAAASEEQSAASEEINRTIVEVNDMAGQTATAMAEAAQAVTSLAAQAQNLTSLIQDMKQV